MESLKPLLLIVVLGCVGYSVYVALNHAPPPEFATLSSEFNKPAAPDSASQSNMGAADGATATPGNPWQAPPDNTTATAVSSGSSQSASTPASAAMGSLPFGLGSSSVTSSTSNPPAPPQSQLPTGLSSSPPPTRVNAVPAGVIDAPNAVPPSVPATTSSAPRFNTPTSNLQNPATPVQSSAAAPSADPQVRHDYEASMRAALTLLNQGQLVEALRELSQWYGNPVVTAADEPRFIDLLSQLAGTVIYSRDPWLGPPYQVRAGESLESIAQQNQVPWQLLAKINGIQNPNSLMPGEKLKLVHGPFQAQLNVQQGWLALFVDGLYAGRFRVQMSGPLVKPDGAYPVVKFSANLPGAAPQAPYISLGGDLHLRVPDDALPPGVTAARISRQDMSDVFDMLSERSQVTITR